MDKNEPCIYCPSFPRMVLLVQWGCYDREEICCLFVISPNVERAKWAMLIRRPSLSLVFCLLVRLTRCIIELYITESHLCTPDKNSPITESLGISESKSPRSSSTGSYNLHSHHLHPTRKDRSPKSSNCSTASWNSSTSLWRLLWPLLAPAPVVCLTNVVFQCRYPPLARKGTPFLTMTVRNNNNNNNVASTSTTAQQH
jgi:hypothetical protein